MRDTIHTHTRGRVNGVTQIRDDRCHLQSGGRVAGRGAWAGERSLAKLAAMSTLIFMSFRFL